MRKGKTCKKNPIPISEKHFSDRAENWHAYTKGVNSAISTGSALGRLGSVISEPYDAHWHVNGGARTLCKQTRFLCESPLVDTGILKPTQDVHLPALSNIHEKRVNQPMARGILFV